VLDSLQDNAGCIPSRPVLVMLRRVNAVL